MTTYVAGADLMDRARSGLRRSAISRELHAVAAGKRHTLSRDLLSVQGAPEILERLTARMKTESPPLQRLVNAFEHAGLSDAALDCLSSRSPYVRLAGVRVVGALRLERAVPCVAPLLAARERRLRDAAARALGRIGGTRSAEALLLAIQRAGLRRVLVVELARAAPDLFLEVALYAEQRPGVLSAVAIAAGLRRRHTAVGPLLAMLVSGTRRQRVISSRALGWIGARTAVPVLVAALEDRDWTVRMSAAKALTGLHEVPRRSIVELLVADRNPRVRKAGLRLMTVVA